jgi:hypothetical protein
VVLIVGTFIVVNDLLSPPSDPQEEDVVAEAAPGESGSAERSGEATPRETAGDDSADAPRSEIDERGGDPAEEVSEAGPARMVQEVAMIPPGPDTAISTRGAYLDEFQPGAIVRGELASRVTGVSLLEAYPPACRRQTRGGGTKSLGTVVPAEWEWVPCPDQKPAVWMDGRLWVCTEDRGWPFPPEAPDRGWQEVRIWEGHSVLGRRFRERAFYNDRSQAFLRDDSCDVILAEERRAPA